MENLQRQIDEILKRMDDLDNKENKTELGTISIVNGNIKLELLLDAKLFDDNDLGRLQKIAEDLQLLMLDIEKKIK
jgi:hypothetical protein